jgi:hypothetical protein
MFQRTEASFGPPRTRLPSNGRRCDGDEYASRIRSATIVGRGAHVSIPLWFLLPVCTPVGIIVFALALQRLERKVLVSSQDAIVRPALAEGHIQGTRDGQSPETLRGPRHAVRS